MKKFQWRVFRNVMLGIVFIIEITGISQKERKGQTLHHSNII